MFKHRIKAFLLATCALALMTPTALASGHDTSVTVSSGSLVITTAPTVANFTAVTLSGVDQTTTAILDDFEVNDSRGTGAGWNVTTQATQFKEVDALGAYVTGGKTLPTGSLKLAQPAVAQDGTTSTSPTITAGPYTIDASSAVKFASSAVDTGMGKYDFSDGTAAAGIPLTLTLKPATTYAKTYKSEVTITLASAP